MACSVSVLTIITVVVNCGVIIYVVICQHSRSISTIDEIINSRFFLC